MKNILLIIGLLISVCVNAQDYITRNGNISFYSHTPLEDINAQNNDGDTALHLAVEYGNSAAIMEIINLLLPDNRILLDLVNNKGDSILHVLIKSGLTNIAIELITMTVSI